MNTIRIVRRDGVSLKYKIGIYALAFVISFGAAAILLEVLGVNSIKYFVNMLTIGLANSQYPDSNIENFIEILIPMMIVSLGLALAFRIRYWNIGGEGQFIFGAIAGYTVYYYLNMAGVTSSWLITLLAGIAGGLAGAVYGLIPALLKVKFNTNETLMTLMFNYIALYLLQFLGNTASGNNIFLSKTSERTTFAAMELKLRMPSISIGKFDLNISLIVAFMLFVLFFIYLKYSKQGYEMSVVGDSEGTASYAGMSVKAITVRTVFISAFLVGLAGAMSFCSCGQLSESITNNVGFTGIIVAWLAKLNPVMIFAVSLFICMLQYGSMNAGIDFSNIDRNFADILQAIILFTVLASEFFIRFKVIIKPRSKAALEANGGDGNE